MFQGVEEGKPERQRERERQSEREREMRESGGGIVPFRREACVQSKQAHTFHKQIPGTACTDE